MRKIVRASMLVLVLAVSAPAGEMGQPVTPPPPPANATQTSTEPTTDGEMGYPATDGNMGQPKGDMGNGVADTATEIGLNLLLTLLALF